MKKIILLFLSLIFCCSVVSAEPIKDMVFLGDSLSDNGKLYQYMLHLLPKSPPYYNGRFSDGPVWSENVAQYYQDNYKITTENYAISDAAVMLRGPLRGALPLTLDEEVTSYLLHFPKKDESNTLFFIWIGANDYLDEEKEDPNKLAIDVTQGIQADMGVLIRHGAKNFFLINMPDLSRVPRAKGNDNAGRFGLLSQYHKQLLEQVVINMQHQYPQIKIGSLDVYTMMNDLLDHPEKYDANITNTTDACWSGGYFINASAEDKEMMKLKNVNMNSSALAEAYRVGKASKSQRCDHPEQYVFWDQLHPTAVTHRIFAKAVEDQLVASGFVVVNP